MANTQEYKDTIKAYPTHILIPEDKGEEERVMYANWNGKIFFIDGFQPERGKSYKLVPNTVYEEFSQHSKTAE